MAHNLLNLTSFGGVDGDIDRSRNESGLAKSDLNSDSTRSGTLRKYFDPIVWTLLSAE